MKIVLKLTGIVFCFMIMLTCSKKDDNSPTQDVESTPSANATLDNSNAGIYKGIIVGSLGYFKITLKNGDNNVSCKLKFDNNMVILTNSGLTDWNPGDGLSEVRFTGTLNGLEISLSFSCNNDGSSPYASVYIPNHSAVVSCFKEKSGDQIKCYEGTYSIKYSKTTENGEWSIVCNKKDVKGYMSGPDGKTSISGQLKGNKLVLENDIELKIDDNTISGSFNNEEGGFVTITGTRSL